MYLSHPDSSFMQMSRNAPTESRNIRAPYALPHEVRTLSTLLLIIFQTQFILDTMSVTGIPLKYAWDSSYPQALLRLPLLHILGAKIPELHTDRLPPPCPPRPFLPGLFYLVLLLRGDWLDCARPQGAQTCQQIPLFRLQRDDTCSKILCRHGSLNRDKIGSQQLLIGLGGSDAIAQILDLFVHDDKLVPTCGIFRVLKRMVYDLLP